MQLVKINNLLNTVVISELRQTKGKSVVEKKVPQLEVTETDMEELTFNESQDALIGDKPTGVFEQIDLFDGEPVEAQFQMSRKQKSRIRLMINYALNRYNDISWKFYTITTCQHKNGMSDVEIASAFSQVMENLKKNYGLEKYLWVAERQPSTGDLHYHIFASGAKLDYKKLIPYLNGKFPHTGTNVIHGKLVKTATIAGYVAKYVTKNDVVLHCRPSQISFDLIADYRMNADQYETRIELDEASEEFEHILKQCDSAISSFNNEYSTVYYLRPFSTLNVWDAIKTIQSNQ